MDRRSIIKEAGGRRHLRRLKELADDFAYGATSGPMIQAERLLTAARNPSERASMLATAAGHAASTAALGYGAYRLGKRKGHKEAEKTAMLHGMFDELEKIARAEAMQKLAATGLSIEQLVKLAAHDDEIFKLLKAAGIFERLGRVAQRGAQSVGRGARRAYNAAQVGTGNLMMGYGHGIEHGLGELAMTTSPLKGAIAAVATDPHLQKAIGKGAKSVGRGVASAARSTGKAVSRAAGKLRPAPIGPGGPPMVPAFAG